MNTQLEIKKLWRAIHRLKCCVANIDVGSDPTLAHMATIITDFVVGSNVIPHGINGNIRSVFYVDNSNRKLEFSDEKFDDTNIYIYSDEAMSNVKIIVLYEVV